MTGSRYLEKAERGDHLVQFYRQSRTLALSLAFYAANGHRLHESVVIIAIPEHTEAVRALLSEEFDVRDMESRGRLKFLDAETTLAAFCRNGKPVLELFEKIVPPVLDEARCASPVRKVRAYGEMVDLLRHAGDVESAIALEGFWNDLARRQPFALFCAYQEGLSPDVRGEVLATHTHCLSDAHDEER